MQFSSSSDGLAGLLARVASSAKAAQDAELSEALAAGFDSVEARRAHEQELQRLRADAEARKAREAHADAVLTAVGSRISDDVAHRLRMGEGLEDTEAHRAVCEWMAGEKPTLVLTGGTGVGKTVAAVRAMLTASRAQFVRALRIGAHFEPWSADREAGIAPLNLGVDLLVIDDLGQEPIEDRRAMPAIEEALDARQSKKTRTLITTNLDTTGIRSRYSERIRSRLAQNAALVGLGGTDKRRAGR
jgi:DNA replication protein DnaC